MGKIYLSKSKLLSGRQCQKRLYLEINKPELREVSDETEARFQIGYEVGAKARDLFPGVLVTHDDDLSAALRKTEALVLDPAVPAIFEATFAADGVLIRADILQRAGGGTFRLIEVKAAAKAKSYHYEDCAIQLWVLRQLGYEISSVQLAFGRRVLGISDITEEATKLAESVPAWIEESRRTLALGQEPAVDMGPHCSSPFECSFVAYCEKVPRA